MSILAQQLYFSEARKQKATLTKDMTVASLWKALERAPCGQRIGVEELKDHRQIKKRTNPWNINKLNRLGGKSRPTLAVDLSIWICESLLSSAMSENHTDPCLHLVYTRTLRLLNSGLKLVMVLEGKRRRRKTEINEESYQNRRDGSKFWKACQRCYEMLNLLGVPTFWAKAEGEALCALLNRRGIVDGVISNDGDCFLFGAQVVYTKFSIENLEKRQVMRFDADNLRACVDDDDRDEQHLAKDLADGDLQNLPDVVSLSRSDMIAFAVLTGSDLAGNGLIKVGCRKAIRFIKKCQLDNPLKADHAAMNELKSWAKASVPCSHAGETDMDANCDKVTHCSCCGHPGNKRSHAKYGCKLCGTSPGESCFPISQGDRFRRALRERALAMQPAFDPAYVENAYMQPNGNQLPPSLAESTSPSLRMGTPRLRQLLESKYIIRGNSLAESRKYVLKSLSKLLAGNEVARRIDAINNRGKDGSNKTDSKKTNDPSPIIDGSHPAPVHILSATTRAGVPCYKILWKLNVATTDDEGKSIDHFEFSTIVERQLAKKCYPDLVRTFVEEGAKRLKQGNTEQRRRREFLNSLCTKSLPRQKAQDDGDGGGMKKKQEHGRRRSGSINNRVFDSQRLTKSGQKTNNGSPKISASGSDDVWRLLVCISEPRTKDSRVCKNSKTSTDCDHEKLLRKCEQNEDKGNMPVPSEVIIYQMNEGLTRRGADLHHPHPKDMLRIFPRRQTDPDPDDNSTIATESLMRPYDRLARNTTEERISESARTSGFVEHLPKGLEGKAGASVSDRFKMHFNKPSIPSADLNSDNRNNKRDRVLQDLRQVRNVMTSTAPSEEVQQKTKSRHSAAPTSSSGGVENRSQTIPLSSVAKPNRYKRCHDDPEYKQHQFPSPINDRLPSLEQDDPAPKRQRKGEQEIVLDMKAGDHHHLDATGEIGTLQIETFPPTIGGSNKYVQNPLRGRLKDVSKALTYEVRDHRETNLCDFSRIHDLQHEYIPRNQHLPTATKFQHPPGALDLEYNKNSIWGYTTPNYCESHRERSHYQGGSGWFSQRGENGDMSYLPSFPSVDTATDDTVRCNNFSPDIGEFLSSIDNEESLLQPHPSSELDVDENIVEHFSDHDPQNGINQSFGQFDTVIEAGYVEPERIDIPIFLEAPGSNHRPDFDGTIRDDAPPCSGPGYPQNDYDDFYGGSKPKSRFPEQVGATNHMSLEETVERRMKCKQRQLHLDLDCSRHLGVGDEMLQYWQGGEFDNSFGLYNY